MCVWHADYYFNIFLSNHSVDAHLGAGQHRSDVALSSSRPPAVSMLLSNGGLMGQLQTLLSSTSSSSSSPAPAALLCCGHLLLSSLVTLQRLHSAQVHAELKSFVPFICIVFSSFFLSFFFFALIQSCWVEVFRWEGVGRGLRKCAVRSQNFRRRFHLIEKRGKSSALGGTGGIKTPIIWKSNALVLFKPNPASRRLRPLSKVPQSVSWSLEAAVQQLLFQKRNTDDLLLGNRPL